MKLYVDFNLDYVSAGIAALEKTFDFPGVNLLSEEMVISPRVAIEGHNIPAVRPDPEKEWDLIDYENSKEEKSYEDDLHVSRKNDFRVQFMNGYCE